MKLAICGGRGRESFSRLVRWNEWSDFRREKDSRPLGARFKLPCIFLLISLSCLQFAEGQSPPASPKQPQSILRGNFWYDKTQDSFRPPRELDDPDIPLRHSDWLKQSKPDQSAKKTQTPTNTTSSRWFPTLSGELFNYLSIIGLATLLILGATLLYLTSARAWLPSRFRTAKKFESAKIDLSKVTDLPFEVRPTRHDPLSEAEALMMAGRYGEATSFLYGYMLLALDQAGHIHLQRGKTNRMYVRELASQPELRSMTQKSMLAFEDAFFGRYQISRERFMDLWDQLERFHGLIRNDKQSHVTAREVAR